MSDLKKMDYAALEELLEEGRRVKKEYISYMSAAKNNLTSGIQMDYVGTAGTTTEDTSISITDQTINALDDTLLELETEINRRKAETEAQEAEQAKVMESALDQNIGG